MIPAIVLFGILGILFGIILMVVSKYFHVDTDPRVAEVLEALPHAHCGACGFAGCEAYAEAVVLDPHVSPDLCIPGGALCAGAVALIVGKNSSVSEVGPQKIARLLCNGGKVNAVFNDDFEKTTSCKDAHVAGANGLICPAGCMGLGDCKASCKFASIIMSDAGIPVINATSCVGCGACTKACPRGLLVMEIPSPSVTVQCSSLDKGQVVRTYCKTGCIACGICVKTCPVTAIVLENNCAKIDPSVCTNCGTCIAKCPTKAIVAA